jgi:hypothetical protein
MVLLQLFSDLNKNKNITGTPFKLPIEYVSHSIINNTIQNDLEMNHEKSIYEHIFNSVSSNDPENERNSLLEKWTKYYTTDQSFLKDTQKIIKRFNHYFPDYKSTQFMKEYLKFKEETSFIDKYQYIGFDMLKPLNYSPLFLHCLSLYNLGSPIISLLSPLFVLIIPFFIIRIKGIPINIQTYINYLKLSLGNNGIFNLFTNFTKLSSQQRISSLFTLVFYFIQIYSNVVSCIKFYRNIHLITEFLYKYKSNLKFFIDTIDTLETSMIKYKSYSKFIYNIKERKKSICSLYKRINTIIDSKNTMVKISQIGLIMNIYYEIFMDDIHHQNMLYLFQLGDYISDMRGLCTIVKDKKIRKCKFGNKTKINDGYYLPHINEKYKTNTIHLSKNILITGPNAAGKTTTIKSLLINTILSQQIGYGCYKSAVIYPYDYFHSYLNIPDTSGRDSLFQAEARRCKDILECITDNLDKNHLCIFDEIYSGTNPNDAVMCAKLYLKYMNKKSNVNYIITTHYIQLCEYFENDSNVINMKMDVEETEDKIVYLYKLVNGISYVHGGKYVLKQLDYPKYLFD